MSTNFWRWGGAIGTIATILLVEPMLQERGSATVIAKTSVEIGDIAKAITVLITAPNAQGSGAILQRQGDTYTILTAAHVVRDKGSYKITTPDDRKYEVISSSIRSAPGNIDLAVVKFRSTTKYPTAKIGNCNVLKVGMDIYVAGFPGATKALTESVMIFREGKVSANSSKTFDAGYSLVYSNDTLPGMSGGAVLNSEGELVAIHGRGDRDDSGAKTGLNLGIPINRFATVAKNLGVELDRQIEPIPQNTAPKGDDYIALGVQKYRKKDYRGSFDDFNRALELNPNLAIAYRWRGFLKEGRFKDNQGGLADYDRSLQLDPNNDAIAYNNRGNLKANKLQDTQGGLSDLNRAIQINPNLENAYNNRGLLKYEKLQDSQGALADYNRAIQINPNYVIAYYNRGSLKANKLQDSQGALADYDRAIQLDPNYALAYNNRGLLKYEKLQDIQGASDDYNRAIQLDPTLPPAYNNRGVLKANKLQDIQGALVDYNRAIQLDPNYAMGYNNRGFLKYNKLQDVRGAIADMQQAAKLFQQQHNTRNYQRSIEFLRKWQ
jgi:tetratricopeptide (TPR) repeat protein